MFEIFQEYFYIREVLLIIVSEQHNFEDQITLMSTS